jgi:hypothetical protein
MPLSLRESLPLKQTATPGPTNATTIANAVISISTQLNNNGVPEVTANDDGLGNIIIVSSGRSFFSVQTSYTPGTGGGGTPGAGSWFGTAPGAETVTPPATASASATGNAENAISSINAAVGALAGVYKISVSFVPNRSC